jgi:bacterioferritin (cytochrome b1)
LPSADDRFQEFMNMQPTTIGPNRTGGDAAPAGLLAMQQAVEDLPADVQLGDDAQEATKLQYIAEADAVGSVPPPATLKGVVKTGMAKLRGTQPTLFLDKLGERLAFERTGTRLYDALLLKYRAVQEDDPQVLAPVEIEGRGIEEAEQALMRIRAEELEHFNLLCEAMRSLGGDPTAQTPCADVTAVASSGLMQVLNDPRTTLAQCLNTMLTAELTDNAAWELLIRLADEAGETELAGQFLAALGQEQEHLEMVQAWLNALLIDQPAPQAI